MKTKILLFIFIVSFFTNANAQWQSKSAGVNSGVIHCFIESGGVLFAGGNVASISSSTDNGNSWVSSNTGISSGDEILCLGKNSAGLFAGSGTIYFSNNNGVSWTNVNSSGNAVWSFAFLTDTVFAATMGGGVTMSTNNGASWTSTNTGITTTSVHAILKKGNLLFAGTYGNGVFVSSNSGVNWSLLNGSPLTVRCLETDGTNIYAGTNGSGLYISSNNGASWTNVVFGNGYVFDIIKVGTSLLAASGDVYRSLDNGLTWTIFMNGINTTCTYGAASFIEDSSYVFCGLEAGCAGSVFRIGKNEVLSGIESIEDNFFLSIYPNPVTSSSTLHFNTQLNNAEAIIYDMLGKEMMRKSFSGNEVQIEKGKMESGVYFVKVHPVGYLSNGVKAGEKEWVEKLMVE